MPDSKDNMNGMKGKSFDDRQSMDKPIPVNLQYNVGDAIRNGKDPLIEARRMIKEIEPEVGFTLDPNTTGR